MSCNSSLCGTSEFSSEPSKQFQFGLNIRLAIGKNHDLEMGPIIILLVEGRG